MPPRSKVKQLPPTVKTWLDAALVEGNFSDYQHLSEACAARGFAISKSALHAYGQEFEERLAAVKLSTEQARAVVVASPDDDNSVNDALIRLVQERLFAILVDANTTAVDLPKMARAVADLGRTSISQRKYMAEVKVKVEEAASAVDKIARKGGLTSETADQIRAQILGIGQ